MKNFFLEDTNKWWEDSKFRFDVLYRDNYVNKLIKKKRNWVDILIGARRVGKTSIIKQLINHYLDSGKNPNKIIYIVSDLFRDQIDIVEIVRNQLSKVRKNSRIYLFVDEVQEIKDWQSQIKYLYDNFKVKIFLSGSSSLVLSKGTSKLTGRFLLTEVLPLSYSEFLDFSHLKNTNKNFENYLQTGGYPEIVLSKSKEKLASIIESTLYRDLLSEYGIRNIAILSDLLDYLSDMVTSSVSLNKIRKAVGISEETASFYLEYLANVYLIYPVYKFGASHRITKGSTPKYYFNDTGVLFWRSRNKKIGQLAENLMYLNLRRVSLDKENPDIFYTEVNERQEVDFIHNGKIYEVKYRSQILEEDLLKYSNDKNIEFVISDDTKITEAYNAYPEISYSKLRKVSYGIV